MFNRANSLLGTNWTLHDLRHTAAYRLARDPKMPLTDVQWVLGHARGRLLGLDGLAVVGVADDTVAGGALGHR
jgi:hypothetical protein